VSFLDMTGDVAFVTGAARGIGAAIAARLHAAGAVVIISDIDAAVGEATANAIGVATGRSTFVPLDVTDGAAVASCIADVVKRFGRVDVLINNAGITGRTAPLWETNDDDWQRVLEVNLSGVFHCCRAAIGPMRAAGSGRIVNVASVAGKEGNPNLIPYSAAKAGVIALSKALAKEVATDNVRVNAVAPGVVDTDILAQLGPQTVAYMLSKIPMGRFGTVEEIAAVVHFLASRESSFVTGQCYDASGGRATY